MVRVWGANVNRNTMENVGKAGLAIENVEHLRCDMVKLIVAGYGGDC